MRFDAYAGSVRGAGVNDVVQALEWSLKGIVLKGPKLKRYGSDTWAVHVANRMAVWVGRDEFNDTVYFEGKGETSPIVAKAIRTHFPKHGVARGDVCEDYEHEGSFEALRSVVIEHKGPKVKSGYIALPDDRQDGATWQAGRRGKGVVGMVRVYEAGKHPDRVHLGRPDWTRVEGEFHPHYAADKLAAATFTPTQFWGLSAWTQRVGEALCHVEIPRYAAPERTVSFEKTTAYIARTFKRHFAEMLEDQGDWECIGRELEAVWKEDDAAATLLRRRSWVN